MFKKIVFWLPRVLGILYILFVAMFALDIFGQGYSLWQTVVGLFMHLIPAYLLIAVLVLAWKRPKLGGVGYLVLALIYIFTIGKARLVVGLPILAPAVLTGVLFYFQKPKT